MACKFQSLSKNYFHFILTEKHFLHADEMADVDLQENTLHLLVLTFSTDPKRINYTAGLAMFSAKRVGSLFCAKKKKKKKDSHLNPFSTFLNLPFVRVLKTFGMSCLVPLLYISGSFRKSRERSALQSILTRIFIYIHMVTLCLFHKYFQGCHDELFLWLFG